MVSGIGKIAEQEVSSFEIHFHTFFENKSSCYYEHYYEKSLFSRIMQNEIKKL